MEIVGELSVSWTEASETITWTSTLRVGTSFKSKEKRLTSQDFKRISKEFRNVWDQCYNDLKNGAYSTAQSCFERARRNLQIQLTPADFNLADLPKGAIVVSIEPDSIPIELFDVEGEPFCIRNQLIYKKQLDNPPSQRILQKQKPVDPKKSFCYMAVMNNCPCPDRSGHWTSVYQCLRSLYGSDNVCYRKSPGKTQGVSIDDVLAMLKRPHLGAFYYFGHGGSGPVGSLELDHGRLDAESLHNRFKELSLEDAGLVFLNACWTAGLENHGLDLAKVFCLHGWQAVIGTIAPPIGSQAACFAEEFFSQLRRDINIARAFHKSQYQAWRRYKQSQVDSSVPDLTWAVYRLYISEDHLCLNTPFTQRDYLVDPWSGEKLGSLAGDKEMQCVIAQLLSRFKELPEPRQLIQIAMEVPGGKRFVHRILRVAIGSPDSHIAESIFDISSRTIFRGAIINTFLREDTKMSSEDILNSLNHPRADISSRYGTLPHIDVPDNIIRRFLQSFQRNYTLSPLNIDDIMEILPEKIYAPAYNLFDSESGRLKFESLSESARCIINDAAKFARANGQPIQVHHLIAGLISFSFKMLPRTITEKIEVSLPDEWNYRISDITTYGQNDNIELYRDNFSLQCLQVFADCLFNRPIRNIGETVDDFWYSLMDSLYWLIKGGKIPINDGELLPNILILIEGIHKFHETVSVIPRIMRDVIHFPEQSPGFPEGKADILGKDFRDVKNTLDRAILDPESILIVPYSSRVMIGMLLEETKKSYKKIRKGHLEPLILSWREFHGHWPILARREKHWYEVFRTFSHTSISPKSLAQKFGISRTPVLLCISKIDPSMNNKNWKLFSQFLDELKKSNHSQKLMPVLVADDELLKNRKELQEDPYATMQSVQLSDKSIKHILHHHAQYWLSKKDPTRNSLEYHDRSLEEILDVARGTGKGDLLSNASGNLQAAIRQINDIPVKDTDCWNSICKLCSS